MRRGTEKREKDEVLRRRRAGKMNDGDDVTEDVGRWESEQKNDV